MPMRTRTCRLPGHACASCSRWMAIAASTASSGRAKARKNSSPRQSPSYPLRSSTALLTSHRRASALLAPPLDPAPAPLLACAPDEPAVVGDHSAVSGSELAEEPGGVLDVREQERHGSPRRRRHRERLDEGPR